MSNNDFYKNHFDQIKILNNPLTTEEGYLNESCVKELESVLNNIPETYERLKSDPEWIIKCWITDSEILGAFSNSVIHLFCYAPHGFENTVNYLRSCLHLQTFTEELKGDNFRMAKLSLCEINKIYWDCLGDLEYFNKWNEPNENGDWIDLSACLRNACNIIRFNRRHDAAFDIQFELNYEGEFNETE